jgi:hypothetical protein
MVAIKTTVEDLERIVGFLSRQIGWVELSKVKKALGSVDERKIRTMVEFSLIERDGANIRLSPRGHKFASDQRGSLRDVIMENDLYRTTVEWIHYGKREEVTATSIGQYWEGHHTDTLGDLSGSTLNDGAVTFGRIVQGAGLGDFKIGRGGRETRVEVQLSEVASLLDPQPADEGTTALAATEDSASLISAGARVEPVRPTIPDSGTPEDRTVNVTASPKIHVNLEIHIAADATAETVKEIFKNMARYVLDKSVADDG